MSVVSAVQAAVSDVQVIGSTNVQALVRYQAPSSAACTVEISESSDFKLLIHDVNPALFAGANSDARTGALSDGTDRVFVAGKRAVEQAADGKWYSRALQTNTVHFLRIRCGADTATGAFRTANIPVGVTYPWPIPQDPKTGQFRWPSVDNNDRNQTIIDPNYGTLIRRVSIPGDAPSTDLNFRRRTFAAAAGANWTNPTASLANDSSATISGAGQDWLVLTNPNIALSPAYIFGQTIDFVTVRIKGSPAQRNIDVCLTIDGANCQGNIRTVALDSNDTTVGTSTPLDTWGEALWAQDVSRNAKFGVMIRPSAAGGAISIQYAEMDVVFSEHTGFPDAGNFRTCAPLKSNGGYHCSVPGSGGNGANFMFWIQPETGEVRWLGKFQTPQARGGVCNTTNAMWDTVDPNTYYCQAQANNRTSLLKGTYTGNDVAAPPGAAAQFQWVNLTPGTSIEELAQKLNPDYNPAAFVCELEDISNQYATYRCNRAGQNTIGWIVVFNLGNKQPLGGGGTGGVIAAAKSWTNSNARWCGLHAIEPLGHINWVGWTPNLLYSAGNIAPYQVTLKQPLPASTGRMTIMVSGEPGLMSAEAGDWFRVEGAPGDDILRIVEKKSSMEWVVDRVVIGGNVTARSADNAITAFCNAFVPKPSADGYQSGYVYWNFLEDPFGTDATGRAWVIEKQLTGLHVVQRGEYRVQAGYDVVSPGAPKSFSQPISYHLPANPPWAGTRVGTNYIGIYADQLSNAYQSHPSYENYQATQPGRNNWFVDFIPFIGDSTLSSSLTLVQTPKAYSQVYRVNETQLHRDLVPTFARCGGRQLKDISPGPITDQDTYAYCVGGGCVVERPFDPAVYVNCPQPAGPRSRCTQADLGDPSSVCVADLAPYGQSITQFYFDASSPLRNRVLTNAMMAWNSDRADQHLGTASPLPDGSWVLFPSFANNARRDVFMVKVPPQPSFEGDPRGGAQAVSTAIPLVSPAGAEQVVVRYGVGSNLGSSSAPQPCRGGSNCPVAISARPFELLYTKAIFQDGSGKTVAEGPLQVHLTGGTTGSGLEKPKVAAAGIVNAASGEQKLAPGALVSIVGENLANCDAIGDLPLPAALCDSSVLFNGQSARFLFASPARLNVMLPSSVVPQQDLEVIVDRSGLKSDPVTVPGSAVSGVAPAIFSYYAASGAPRAVVLTADYALNGPDKPLHAGEIGVLYANALGATDPIVPDGEAAPTNPLARTTGAVEVRVNDVPQRILFSGLVPQSTGVYQVNFTLDPSTSVKSDDQNFISVQVNGIQSPRLLISLAAQ